MGIRTDVNPELGKVSTRHSHLKHVRHSHCLGASTILMSALGICQNSVAEITATYPIIIPDAAMFL